MSLIQLSLKNRFAVLAVVLALCTLGAAVIPGITIDILPDFKKPVVVSFFSYPGLPTLDMEKSVASRVERALTLAGKIEHQESRTVPGATVIKVFFQPGADASSAMNDIVNLEASDMFHLPPGIEWPFTLRSEPANLPVVLAAISGEGLSESELYSIGYYAVRNKMGGLKGVQIPHPFGGKFRQMMIYVDPAKLQAHHLSATDVVDAMQKSNLVLAGGTATMGGTDYQIHPRNTLPDVEEIEAIPIAVRDDRPIFIRDVGRVVDDAALQYNIVRVNGNRSVYCPLLREPGENTIAVVDRIYEGIEREIPKMKERGDIPEATEVTLVSDQSNYIRKAMSNLLTQVGLGALLVTIVVFLFLRSFVPTIIIVSTILLAILIGALGFAFSGQTINVMTLGGIALAIGTVVDAGIVVVENIIRHSRLGKSPMDAAREGPQEVSGAILAGTATTLAVFLPAVFLTGMIKYLFLPLSLAATLTIGASYFLALTVVPAYCATFVRERIRKKQSAEQPVAKTVEPAAQPKGLYGRLLHLAMAAPAISVLVIVVAVGASFALLPKIGTELFPTVDAGSFELRLKTLPGTSLLDTEKLVARVEESIKQVIPEEEIETIISNIGLPVGKGAGFSTVLSSNSGPDTAYVIVNLKQEQRSVTTASYIENLRGVLAAEYPLEEFMFVSGGIVNMALNEGVPTPISVQVSAGTLGQCRDAAERIVEAVRPIAGTRDVQIAQSLEYPQFDVQVDRTRAKYLGVDQEEVAKTVLTALGSSVGYDPTIWIDPKTGVDFFMGVQYESNEFESLDEVRNIPLSLNTPDGPVTIPLSNIATVKRVTIPGEIAHYNISRVNDVHVNISGRDLGSVAADIDTQLAGMEFENGVAVTLRGPVEKMRSGMSMLGVGLAVATLLVYLVLMAQFRSFVDPLIIMLAVPLGVGGVLVVLYLTDTYINIQSLMGTLMMIGVVVNNSILLVEFANQRRAEGLAPRDAAMSAAQVRLRPILMTSLTLVASMLPLSIQWAPGNEAMIPLARALMGGMIVSTVLTLVLVPCVYALVHTKRHQPA
ncbi:efflux RND transporter permease subunit [Allorhodopirellula solitaria]|uniref:Cobalt-zinc-cadmium resistance protein CzcA n=1 Tax=Allorhodopirellula solitaria TaxID=2527987 RepID=A0A5C5XXT3_9BACT|nr:efflux RND transporter permease subunit [Allorhodopirellula solitaria]TWT67183.1 Cobalt-zinc-cadmium resistance protein CzcA [Allorhodopirellula solitaria]